MTTQPNVVEISHSTKTLPCGKCGTEIVVGKNAVMAFCRDCSANLGVKK